MNKKDYTQNLNHPLWQKKRDEVFNHYGRRCNKCETTRSLEVHHKTYNDGKMPWEYPIDNFTVLCERCHSAMHSIQYTQNTCNICGIEISNKYIYCFDCNKNQVKRLREQNKDFERKILDLNKKLAFEKHQAKSIDSVKINKLIAQRDQLISKRSEVEKLLSEIDRNRKEDSLQVQSQIKSIKSLLIAISIIVVVGVAVAVAFFFQKSLSNQDLHAKDSNFNKSEESNIAPVPSEKIVTPQKATLNEVNERKSIASS